VLSYLLTQSEYFQSRAAVGRRNEFNIGGGTHIGNLTDIKSFLGGTNAPLSNIPTPICAAHIDSINLSMGVKKEILQSKKLLLL